MAAVRVIWLLVITIAHEVRCEEIRSDLFSKMKGKFYPTNHSLSLTKVHSELQCASLCVSQKCCLSAVIRQEDDGYLCRTLDTFIFQSDLVDDAMGSYMYKTDLKARSDFVWSAVNQTHLSGANMLIKSGIPLADCRNLCSNTTYCMSVDYYLPASKCSLNGHTEAVSM
ncbi:hypothetical protein CAPTEDRAFT_209036, partial [Capitella teleta]